MKNTLNPILLCTLAIALIVGSAGKAMAHYDHDDKGWYDDHHVHHAYIIHNGHRGYWDHDDHGAEIFIRI